MRETAQRGADAPALAGTFAAILYAGVGLADAASHSANASHLRFGDSLRGATRRLDATRRLTGWAPRGAGLHLHCVPPQC